jgi:hypothetical protein
MLTKSILLLVLHYVPLIDCSQFSLTCKRFYQLFEFYVRSNETFSYYSLLSKTINNLIVLRSMKPPPKKAPSEMNTKYAYLTSLTPYNIYSSFTNRTIKRILIFYGFDTNLKDFHIIKIGESEEQLVGSCQETWIKSNHMLHVSQKDGNHYAVKKNHYQKCFLKFFNNPSPKMANFVFDQNYMVKPIYLVRTIDSIPVLVFKRK